MAMLWLKATSVWETVCYWLGWKWLVLLSSASGDYSASVAVSPRLERRGEIINISAAPGNNDELLYVVLRRIEKHSSHKNSKKAFVIINDNDYLQTFEIGIELFISLRNNIYYENDTYSIIKATNPCIILI